MKIKLTDIPVYYVNLEGEDEKRKHTESMLKNLGFKYVQRFNAIRHEAGRIIGCADLIILSSAQQNLPLLF